MLILSKRIFYMHSEYIVYILILHRFSRSDSTRFRDVHRTSTALAPL